MRPIRMSSASFPTVQAALLAAMRNHEAIARSSWMDTARYPDAHADLLRHLWSDLSAIRDCIAARAVDDAERIAA